jgi:hypothetical protein
MSRPVGADPTELLGRRIVFLTGATGVTPAPAELSCAASP